LGSLIIGSLVNILFFKPDYHLTTHFNPTLLVPGFIIWVWERLSGMGWVLLGDISWYN